MPANTYNGVGVSWGIGATISNVVGAFQTNDHTFKAESELIKDGGETTVSKVYYDFREEASFTYVCTGIGPSGIVSTYFPTISDWVSVNDYIYSPINGSWLVDDVSVTRSNTDKAKVTLKLCRYPNVN